MKQALVLLLLLLVGCSTTSRHYGYETTAGKQRETHTHRGNAHSATSRAYPTASEVQAKLEDFYQRWQKAPYRLGGTSRSGIDCSAFVQLAYKDEFGIDLPRSTAEQQHEGQGVHRRWLRPGDLVFFQPKRGPRHVGIYIGDNEFIHASSSKGVTRSNLKHPYWRQSFKKARRISFAN